MKILYNKNRKGDIVRWVKTAVVIVIVSAIIPTIVMVINRLPSEYTTKREEYEITITKDNITETVYELYNLVKLDENNRVTNWLYIRIDGKIADVVYFGYGTDPSRRFGIRFYHAPSYGYRTMYLDLDDPIGESSFSYFNTLKIGLYDEIVVESISSLELLLISLVPLILVSGLLVYQYKELGLKIRKE